MAAVRRPPDHHHTNRSSRIHAHVLDPLFALYTPFINAVHTSAGPTPSIIHINSYSLNVQTYWSIYTIVSSAIHHTYSSRYYDYDDYTILSYSLLMITHKLAYFWCNGWGGNPSDDNHPSILPPPTLNIDFREYCSHSKLAQYLCVI
jgi:hypothetical protein